MNIFFKAAEEKKTGQTYKMFMNKVIDISGTYKIVGSVGFEKCGQLFGKGTFIN